MAVVVVLGMVLGTVTSIGVVGVVPLVTMTGCEVLLRLLQRHRPAVGAAGHDGDQGDGGERGERLRGAVRLDSPHGSRVAHDSGHLLPCSDRARRLSRRNRDFATRRWAFSPGGPPLPPVVEAVADLHGEDGQQPAGRGGR